MAAEATPVAGQSTREHPSTELVAQVDRMLPGALVLVLQTESDARNNGRPLAVDEIALARHVGVKAPERVRILDESVRPDLPQPPLAALIRHLGADNPRMWGLTARYGIVFKAHPTRFLLAHELRHVAQYERLGLERFVRRYLTELLAVGYAHAALEADANAAAAQYR